GDPATSVIGFAKRRNVDTIVVGTRGLGKVKGLFMGSVSRKIVNNAEANCLIVR
ncbi:MAG: universal stress protein, partial [Gammaproteobacteria bacterium]|nr:universal stress protein [Gammaproteobacteria bacterium]